MSVCVAIAATLSAAMSGSIRLYLPAPLIEGAVVRGSAAQAHYLGTVMRRRAGDAVRLFNGRDGEFAASIRTIQRGGADLAVERLIRAQAAESDVWLAFALLKR